MALEGADLRQALRDIEADCKARKLRLTVSRRRVLEVLLASEGPLKAYDIIEQYDTPKPKPPTVYRALQFLVDEGLAHRIEQINAYVPCRVSDHGMAAFLICDTCHHVEEYAAPRPNLDKGNFQVSQWVIEGVGTCGACLTQT